MSIGHIDLKYIIYPEILNDKHEISIFSKAERNRHIRTIKKRMWDHSRITNFKDLSIIINQILPL